MKTDTSNFKFLGVTADNMLVFFTGWNGKGLNDPDLFASGCVMRPVNQEEIDQANDFETVKKEYAYLWEESDKSQSLDEYIEDLIYDATHGDHLYIGQDPSYLVETLDCIESLEDSFKDALENIIGLQYQDWETFDCVACGALWHEEVDFSSWKLVNRRLALEINNILKHAKQQ